MMFICFY